jgi:murein DD-endopeptidase MepM/ murein hydrolase activator NlpD
MPIRVAFAVLACIAGLTVAPPARAAGASGTYLWPVTGNVIRWFEPPSGPYGAGHRGIDIAAPFGTPIQAPADGTVTFAGWVAGSLFLTIDHGNGVKTSYSWLSGLRVAKGDPVKAGQIVALTGHGHPDVPTPHLHFSVRINGVYVDPMQLLGYPDLASLIRLAPIPLPP